jgi:hypothetical protein
MTAPSSSSAWDATDMRLHDLAALAAMLRSIVTETNCMDHQHPEAAQINALVNVIHETTRRACDLHQVEWEAQRAPVCVAAPG